MSNLRKRAIGRPRSNPVHNFFVYDNGSDSNMCTVEGCQQVIEGKHAGNLANHLERIHYHSKEHLEYLRLKDKQTTEEPPSKVPFIKIQMTPEIFMDACVQFVALDGRPINIIKDKGFERLTHPIRVAMPQMSLTKKILKDYITLRAADIKAAMKDDLKKVPFIHWKVDIATRHGTSYLGINIQYIDDGMIKLRTLGVKALTTSHTAENLKDVLVEVSNVYELPLDSGITLTSDNASNMLKLARLLREDQEQEQADLSNSMSHMVADSDSDSDNESVNDDTDDEVRRDQSNGDNQHDDDDGEILPGGERLLEDVGSERLTVVEDTDHFEIDTSGANIISVRCGAHSLQLCVTDVLKCHLERTIDKGRNVVKKLRTETNGRELREGGLSKPVRDNATRWNSTYDMLQGLVEVKDECKRLSKDDPALRISSAEWTKIKECINALKPFKEATLKFQEEQLTPGDFYGAWLKCQLTVSKQTTPIARALSEEMKKREPSLFDNDAFLAALYLDPRYSFVIFKCKRNPAMAADRATKAKRVLMSLHQRILQKSSANSDATSQSTINESGSQENEEASSSQSTEIGDDENVDILDAYLDRISPNEAAAIPQNTEIEKLLIDFENRPKLPRDTNIFDFWESLKYVSPELYQLAKTVISLPMTQVSVERLFSGMKFLISDQRTRMSPSRVEDILLIRTNQMFMRRENCRTAGGKRKDKPTQSRAEDVAH